MSPDALRTLLLDLGYEVRERKSTAYECVLARGDERWTGTGGNPTEAFSAALEGALPSHVARHLAGVSESGVLHAAAMPDDRVETPIATSNTLASEREAAPAPAAPRPSSADTLRAVRAIAREIAEDQTELGLCTARRQRLAITRWIATARALQDEYADDPTIEDAVRAIAGRLTRSSKRWWPGRVTALALAATPAGCASELGLGAHVTTWRDVADRAESVLAQLESDEEDKGCDEYGWADARDCEPAPDAPDAALAEVVRDIEACGGSLATEAASDALPHAEELTHWVRMLRWLRPHTDDAERWAAAIGRCRFWIAMRRSEFSVADCVLDPAHRPPMGWARVLAPASPSVRVEPAQLPPLPSEDLLDAAGLSAWIATALADPLTDQDEIVEQLRARADTVLALDSDEIAGGSRAVRRRLSKLKRKLGEVSPARGPTLRAVVSLEDPERHTQPLADPVRVAVQSRVRGKRALVVTNRDDDDLGARLTHEFGFASIDVRRADPRRLESATDAIALGRFDIVLGVTGFVGHSTDGALKIACERAGVPYVRVAKGRSGACLRALAREFGIAVGREVDAA